MFLITSYLIFFWCRETASTNIISSGSFIFLLCCSFTAIHSNALQIVHVLTVSIRFIIWFQTLRIVLVSQNCYAYTSFGFSAYSCIIFNVNSIEANWMIFRFWLSNFTSTVLYILDYCILKIFQNLCYLGCSRVAYINRLNFSSSQLNFINGFKYRNHTNLDRSSSTDLKLLPETFL